MVFKRKPEGTALNHHTERHTAKMLAWKYRNPLFHRGLDLDEVCEDVLVMLFEKKHRYNPDRGASYVTWCYHLASRYLQRRLQLADANIRRMRKWRPQPLVYNQSNHDRQETVDLLWRTELSPRQREFLDMWCNGGTLRSIGAKVGLSPERVRQIIAKAIQKMRMQAKRVAVKHRIPFDELWGTI